MALKHRVKRLEGVNRRERLAVIEIDDGASEEHEQKLIDEYCKEHGGTKDDYLFVLLRQLRCDVDD